MKNWQLNDIEKIRREESTESGNGASQYSFRWNAVFRFSFFADPKRKVGVRSDAAN